MAISTPNKYLICLSPEQRERLEAITRNGHAPAKKIRHAQILLWSDGHREGGRLSSREIAERLDMHDNSVDRIRKRFVLEGEEPALNRKPRETPAIEPKIDGRVEAAFDRDLLRSGSPRGHLSLDTVAAGRRIGETAFSDARLRGDGTQGIKNELQPWRKQCWCVPEQDAARFVGQMEDILDLYAAEHTEEEPLICMDEASKQLLRDEHPVEPIAPGRAAREDYHYERRGVQSIFMFFDPLRGWRRVSCRDNRTRVDWAEEIRRLLEEDYPHAKKIKLVCDNLNTHDVASLYAAFPAEVAHRLRQHTAGNTLHAALQLAECRRNRVGSAVATVRDRRIGSPKELRTGCFRLAKRTQHKWRHRQMATNQRRCPRFAYDRLYPQF